MTLTAALSPGASPRSHGSDGLDGLDGLDDFSIVESNTLDGLLIVKSVRFYGFSEFIFLIKSLNLSKSI